MKLEVGKYVRFKDKRRIEYIRKIVNIPEDNRYASLYLDKEANYSYGLSPKNVIKVSFNIVDLIKNGDILYFYEDVDNYKEAYVANVPGFSTLDAIKEKIIDGRIKLIGIVTKEQFKSMEYGIGVE